MKLPNVDAAEVPGAKIASYLLNVEHRDGRGKALFFLEFGFSQERWQLLADALRQHSRSHEVSVTEQTEFGTKYTIDGELDTPTGATPNVRVVWFVESGDNEPRLVTAHPLSRREKVE